MVNYFKELPDGYIIDKVIDAKDDIKIKILFSILPMFIFTIVFLCFLPAIIIKYKETPNADNMTVALLILVVEMIVYVIFHELTHGALYKILTKEKLTYGFTLTVAYCGVPNLYLKKVPALLAALAPLVVYSILFTVPLFFINDISYFIATIILFSLHISGCIGDLYVSILLIFKYNGKDVLVNDTGPKQTFYIKK